jgi:glycosyltransferase involved in cell wall biosynthesis
MKKKILHIITGLGNGGAENTLLKLTNGLKKSFDNTILVLGTQNTLEKKFNNQNIKIVKANIKNKYFFFIYFYKIYFLIKKNNPDLIQTWMYHSDLIGSLIGKIILKKKIVWCIRHSNLKLFCSKFSTILISRICSILSHNFVDQIIYSSRNSDIYHKSIGYSNKKGIQISNGYNPDKFKYCKFKNRKIYSLGFLANYRPQKDFFTLLKSLEILDRKKINFKCYMAGHNVDKKNKKLLSLIKQFNLKKKIYLLGELKCTKSFFNKIDYLILSSSFGESFPNVIAESMLQGIPCISTNVGDSKKIISKLGWISEPSNPQELSNKILKALKFKKKNKKGYKSLKKKVRETIIQKFHINLMLENYSKAWKKLIN